MAPEHKNRKGVRVFRTSFLDPYTVAFFLLLFRRDIRQFFHLAIPLADFLGVFLFMPIAIFRDEIPQRLAFHPWECATVIERFLVQFFNGFDQVFVYPLEIFEDHVERTTDIGPVLFGIELVNVFDLDDMRRDQPAGRRWT